MVARDLDESGATHKISRIAPAGFIACEQLSAELWAEKEKLGYEMNWPWTCDLNGRSLDGKATICDTGTIYHCVYCTNLDFCKTCLARLRDNVDDPYTQHITACSSKHRWLEVPSPSSEMYVGPEATYVRTPSVRYKDGGDQILEIFDAGDVQVPVSVKMWQKELTSSWSVVLEDGNDGNVSTD